MTYRIVQELGIAIVSGTYSIKNPFPKEGGRQASITAAEDPRTWGLVVLYFVSFGGFLALTVWFPTYWMNFHHVDAKTAGVLGGVGFSLLAAVVRVFGDDVLDDVPALESVGDDFVEGPAERLILALPRPSREVRFRHQTRPSSSFRVEPRPDIRGEPRR